MKKEYRLLKEKLIAKFPMCEICNTRRSIEINHCLYHDHEGIYDSEENCQAVCHECHNDKGHSRLNKIVHWRRRKWEGYDMQAWNMQVPETRREGFEI